MKLRKIILIVFIFIELLLVIYLTFRVVKLIKNKRILGSSKINIIEKENIIFTSDHFRYFYEPKPNTIEKVNEWVPYKGIYTINSDTLNERFDYSTEKPKDAYRIITLGDSFTYGLYVDTKDNWPEQLEDILNERVKCNKISKFEVINLGVHGYDFEYTVERYRRRGTKYNPDLILWYIIDFMRINEKLLLLLEDYYKKFKDNSELEKYINDGHYYYVWDMAQNESVSKLGIKNVQEYQENTILKINNYYDGPLIVMLLPRINQKDKEQIERIFSLRKNTYLFDQMRNLHEIENAVFPNDGHPNKNGHKIISEDIFKFLFNRKIIPCN